MPITPLDIILLVVMLISALLAMVRGFTREALSLVAWGTAALAAYKFHPLLIPYLEPYLGSNRQVLLAVSIAAIFFGTLIVVSLITMKISDAILDSRVGALDRTLGFVFGLGRGLIVVVVAFVFYTWMVPDRSQPEWVRGAKSKAVLDSTGQWLMSLLPDDPESAILKRLKRQKDDGETPQETVPPGTAPRPDAPAPTPQQRTETPAPLRAAPPSTQQTDRQQLQRLTEQPGQPRR